MDCPDVVFGLYPPEDPCRSMRSGAPFRFLSFVYLSSMLPLRLVPPCGKRSTRGGSVAEDRDPFPPRGEEAPPRGGVAGLVAAGESDGHGRTGLATGLRMRVEPSAAADVAAEAAEAAYVPYESGVDATRFFVGACPLFAAGLRLPEVGFRWSVERWEAEAAIWVAREEPPARLFFVLVFNLPLDDMLNGLPSEVLFDFDLYPSASKSSRLRCL